MIDAVLIAFSGGGGEGRQGGEGINYFGTEGRRFDDDCERSSEDLRGRGDKYLEMMLWVGCSMQFPFHFRLIASSDINYFEVRRCFGSIVGRGIKVKFVTKASRVKNHD